MDGLRPGTAQVWLIGSDCAPSVFAEYERTLDEAERRRMHDLVQVVHRRRFVAAHGAMRHILAGLVNTAPEQIRWRHGPNGKPHLDVPGVHVNLSHSADLAVLAVAVEREVGVDIQWSSPGFAAHRLSERFYPAAEARFVAEATTADDAIERFVRLWARKEAVVKAAGDRIARGLGLSVAGPGARPMARGVVVHSPSLPGLYRVRDLAAPQGFHAAVALRGAAHFRVTSHRWPANPFPTTW